MRIKLAVTTFVLAMLGSTVANAATFGLITLDQTVFNANVGDTIYLTGDFVNTSPTDTIEIDSLSIQDNPAQSSYHDDFTNFYAYDILGPGDSLLADDGPNDYPTYSDIEFADVTLSSHFTGILSIYYDDLTTSQSFLESNQITFAGVPEPGSLSLCASCLVGGSLFGGGLLAKRRRK